MKAPHRQRGPSPFRAVLAGGANALLTGAEVATGVLGGPVLAAAVREAKSDVVSGIAGPRLAAVAPRRAAAARWPTRAARWRRCTRCRRKSQVMNLQLLALQEKVGAGEPHVHHGQRQRPRPSTTPRRRSCRTSTRKPRARAPLLPPGRCRPKRGGTFRRLTMVKINRTGIWGVRWRPTGRSPRVSTGPAGKDFAEKLDKPASAGRVAPSGRPGPVAAAQLQGVMVGDIAAELKAGQDQPGGGGGPGDGPGAGQPRRAPTPRPGCAAKVEAALQEAVETTRCCESKISQPVADSRPWRSAVALPPPVASGGAGRRLLECPASRDDLPRLGRKLERLGVEGRPARRPASRPGRRGWSSCRSMSHHSPFTLHSPPLPRHPAGGQGLVADAHPQLAGGALQGFQDLLGLHQRSGLLVLGVSVRASEVNSERLRAGPAASPAGSP